jgi:hypothetical protein
MPGQPTGMSARQEPRGPEKPRSVSAILKRTLSALECPIHSRSESQGQLSLGRQTINRLVAIQQFQELLLVEHRDLKSPRLIQF